ncbi:MAG: secretin N-terminal domain-containing protein [Planctomycetota bacterium]
MRTLILVLPLLLLACVTEEVPPFEGGAPPGLATAGSARTQPAAGVEGEAEQAEDGGRAPLAILQDGLTVEREADLSVPVIPGSDLYTVNLSGLELGHAIKLLAHQGGINMVVPLELSRPVAASFPAVTLDQALKSLIAENHLRLIEEGGIFSVVQESAPGMKTQVYVLRSLDPVAIETELRGVVGAGGTVVVNTATDTVLITAPVDALQRAEEYLRAVDLPEKQVLIHVRLLEIALRDDFEMGALLNLAPIQIDDVTASLVTDLLSPSESVEAGVTHDKSTLEAALRVLKDITRIHTLANPNLLALDGGQAKIDIIEEVPYIGVTNTVETNTNGSGTSSVQQVEFKETGVRLSIKPTIQRDGRVTVDLDQEVSEVVGFLEGVPATNSRKLVNRFSSADGDSIVIGGLIKDRERKQRVGIPILMDLPLIGALFRRLDTSLEKVNLVIFMTPVIIDPNDTRAAGVSSEFKARWHRDAKDWGFSEGDRLPDVR